MLGIQMPDLTLVSRKNEEFSVENRTDFKFSKELDGIERPDGVTIIKGREEPYNTFWNKVSFLIGNLKHRSYSYRFLGRLRIDNNIPTRPLLLKQSHKNCSKCWHQVSEYGHDVCFYCCTNDIESNEFNYHYKHIKNIINSNQWY